MKEIEMPLYEDDTLEGAIRKAVRGERSESKSRIPERQETFNNLPFGSPIGGTGRDSFTSRGQAVDGAVSAMVQQAEQHYSDRVTAIRSGQRQSSLKIPELGTLVEFYLTNNADPSSLRWRFIDLHVGDLERFEIKNIPRTTYFSTTDIVHAHWIDNHKSPDDNTMKSQFLGRNSNRTYPSGERYRIQFHIYSLFGGLTQY